MQQSVLAIVLDSAHLHSLFAGAACLLATTGSLLISVLSVDTRPGKQDNLDICCIMVGSFTLDL